ncbi:MAG: ribonuclease H-like domain-containing protein, partial [Deltaproteobacteria bacterium]|nr:ribonuclease H-like domain-containing protein [Deltaproteobacteria bacterium]
WPNFRDRAVALDIETNGLPVSGGGYATMVGLYDGCDFRALVQGRDLTRERLEQEFSRYRYLVSFFGAGFDVPFLREAFSVHWVGLHYDICFAGKRVGLKGGLKRVEQELGIARDESVRGFSGYDAVLLWQDYQRGNAQALELLETYNRYDTVNLFELADMVYAKLRQQTGIDGPYVSSRSR